MTSSVPKKMHHNRSMLIAGRERKIDERNDKKYNSSSRVLVLLRLCVLSFSFIDVIVPEKMQQTIELFET